MTLLIIICLLHGQTSGNIRFNREAKIVSIFEVRTCACLVIEPLNELQVLYHFITIFPLSLACRSLQVEFSTALKFSHEN